MQKKILNKILWQLYCKASVLETVEHLGWSMVACRVNTVMGDLETGLEVEENYFQVSNLRLEVFLGGK